MIDVDFQEMIDGMPPGLLLEGTIEIHKSVKGEVWIIGVVSGQEFRQHIPQAILDMVAGKGVLGKGFHMIMGNKKGAVAPIETGPVDG